MSILEQLVEEPVKTVRIKDQHRATYAGRRRTPGGRDFVDIDLRIVSECGGWIELSPLDGSTDRSLEVLDLHIMRIDG
ncbi:hypothetical protein HY970_03810 [Candidatus Kaiserbacteria bacterium]|nr:hypothetical protein [Candidatus Kaiserbacteria bacterium]